MKWSTYIVPIIGVILLLTVFIFASNTFQSIDGEQEAHRRLVEAVLNDERNLLALIVRREPERRPAAVRQLLEAFEAGDEKTMIAANNAMGTEILRRNLDHYIATAQDEYLLAYIAMMHRVLDILHTDPADCYAWYSRSRPVALDAHGMDEDGLARINAVMAGVVGSPDALDPLRASVKDVSAFLQDVDADTGYPGALPILLDRPSGDAEKGCDVAQTLFAHLAALPRDRGPAMYRAIYED